MTTEASTTPEAPAAPTSTAGRRSSRRAFAAVLAAVGGAAFGVSSRAFGKGADAAQPMAMAMAPATPGACPAATPAVAARTAGAADGAAPQVEIANFAFTPGTLTVPVGTTVTWVNRDEIPHTVTSNDKTTFGSQALDTDDTFSFTFTTAGSYPYFCSIHPTMTATVVVK